MGFNVLDTLAKLATESGFAGFFAEGGWQNLVMIVIACVLLYLGIVKGFEPLLLVGIAFGCLLANVSYFPGLDAVNPDLNATNALYHPELWEAFLDKNNEFYHSYGHILSNAGLLDIFYIGVKAGLYPSLIFMGVGAMTDFGPLIADPKSLLLGAAAQLGVFVAFFGAICLGFTGPQAASIGIIGAADGPTSILVSQVLHSNYIGPIAVAAYSYMALVPIIQPFAIKLVTTKKERAMHMPYNPKHVSRSLRICFPIMVTIIAGFIAPMSVSLVGFLMFGNLLRECGCLERLSQTAQNDLANLITLLLGITISFSMQADQFVNLKTLIIMALGLVAFVFDSIAGVMFAKLLNLFCKNKVNPMVGAAGISAFPMSARVIQKMGQEADCTNHLLMHAVGANVAGQIASVLAGGMILNLVPQLMG